jgi:hypothetical protein
LLVTLPLDCHWWSISLKPSPGWGGQLWTSQSDDCNARRSLHVWLSQKILAGSRWEQVPPFPMNQNIVRLCPVLTINRTNAWLNINFRKLGMPSLQDLDLLAPIFRGFLAASLNLMNSLPANFWLVVPILKIRVSLGLSTAKERCNVYIYIHIYIIYIYIVWRCPKIWVLKPMVLGIHFKNLHILYI